MVVSDFTDFLSQLPPSVPLAFCGFLLMMVGSLVLLIRSGLRKRQAAAEARRPQPGRIPTLADEPSLSHDLPDLDLLVGTEPSPGIPMPTADVAPPPAAPPARKSGTYWLQLTDGRRVEAADVLTVSRDLADGSLIVQIGSHAYGHAADITDDDARRRLKAMLRELAQQITAPPREPAARAESSSPTAPAEMPEAAPAPATPVTPPAPRPSVPVSGDESWQLPNFNELANEPLKLRGGRPKQAVPEINIAGAIEAYLQHKLRHTPGFEQRRLHIHPAPGGGVQIEADGRFYEAVADIEDTPTREFIAGAIQEWQAAQ